MTFLKSKYGWLILHEIIGQKKLIRTLHQPPLREILRKILCVAENHGKNGLLSTDLLVRHIRQSFAGESGNVWNGLKTGDEVAQKSPTWQFPTCFPHFPYVSSCFTYCFPSVFGYFSWFPWYFPLFPILGLTQFIKIL